MQANELIRQSSIEPKKYVQNQLLLKKNKSKIESIDISPGMSSRPLKLNNQVSEVAELFSSDDNKTITEVESINLDSKTDSTKNKDVSNTEEDPISDALKDVIVNKEEPVRIRKCSIKMKEYPVETNVTKTVEDILNDISSKIVNQTEIIDEENLIDELADLNEDLNSVCKLKFVKFLV